MSRRILTLVAAALSLTSALLLIAVVTPTGSQRVALASYPDPCSTSGAQATPGGVVICAQATPTSSSSGGGGSGSTSCVTITGLDYASVVDWINQGVPLYNLGTPPDTLTYVFDCPASHPVAIVMVGTLQGVAPTSANALGLWAASLIQFPNPSIGTSPQVNRGAIVHLPTYLYVDPAAWKTLGATATAGPVSVMAVAVPAKVVWTMGDPEGGTVSCNGPGVAYDSAFGDTPPPQACTYTYITHSKDAPGGKYSLSAQVFYHVTWTATGIAGGGDLGLVPGPQTTVPLEVDQIITPITNG